MNLIRKFLHWVLFTYDMDVMIMEGGRQPTRAYTKDAGYDLYVSKATKVPPHTYVNVPTGVAIKSNGVPLWLWLASRSSTMMSHGLLVDTAIIDDGYTGELFMKVYNLTDKVVHLPPGARIGQVVPMVHAQCRFRNVEQFKVKRGERGGKGFGSSGI